MMRNKRYTRGELHCSRGSSPAVNCTIKDCPILATINTARGALSAHVHKIYEVTVGAHPETYHRPIPKDKDCAFRKMVHKELNMD